MKAGEVLYRKGSLYQLVFSRSQDGELYGYVKATDGRMWGEQPIVSILAKGYWESVGGVVEKHGTHDQSTHNPHKGGRRGTDPMRGYKAGEWTKLSDPMALPFPTAAAEQAYLEQSFAAFEQREGRPLTSAERERLIAQANNPWLGAERKRHLENADVYVNGSSMIIVKRDLENPVTDSDLRGLTTEIDRMQRDYPVAGLRVHIDDKEFDTFNKPEGAVMMAYRGGASHAVEPHIFIKSGSMTTKPAGMNGAAPYFVPSKMTPVSLRRVQLTHEWGHLMDKKGGVPFEVKDMAIKKIVDRYQGVYRTEGNAQVFPTSTMYGMSDVAEQFAESFAQYVLAKQEGFKLENPLTLALAKEFKW